MLRSQMLLKAWIVGLNLESPVVATSRRATVQYPFSWQYKPNSRIFRASLFSTIQEQILAE